MVLRDGKAEQQEWVVRSTNVTASIIISLACWRSC